MYMLDDSPGGNRIIIENNVAIFWDFAPCSPCAPTFRRNISPAARWYVARLILDREDGVSLGSRTLSSVRNSK
jgi:hypothetical protein